MQVRMLQPAFTSTGLQLRGATPDLPDVEARELVGNARAEYVTAPTQQGTGVGSQSLVSGGGISNFSAANYLRSRTALAKVRQGAADMKVVRVGNSTELGRGVSASGYTGATTQYGPLPRFVASCNALGIANFQGQSHFGGWESSFPTADTRWSMGAGWGQTGAYGLGGNLTFNNSTANNLSFTPATQTDTLTCWYADAASAGFTLQIDAGGTQAVTVAATSVFKSATITGALGAHTYNIARTSGSVYIAGVWAHNSAVREVAVLSSGWPGGKAADYASTANAWQLMAHLQVVAPDLTFLKGSINDWTYQTATIAQFSAQMQAVITAAQISGDVVLVVEPPTQASSAPLAQQQQYVTAMYALASANGLAIIDHWSAMVSWEAVGGTTSGWYDDAFHPAKVGYDTMAAREAKFMAMLLG